MEKLQTITHPQFGQLSVIIIDGKEMFKAKEVAAMLGYKDTVNAVKQHCRGVVKHHLPSKSGDQEYSLIPESDVWRLIIRSKLPPLGGRLRFPARSLKLGLLSTKFNIMQKALPRGGAFCYAFLKGKQFNDF